MKTLIFLLLSSIAVSASAEKPATCFDSDVVSIQVPVFHQQKKSAKVPYKFKFIQKDLSLPIIIVVGGGPGQNTMAWTRPPILGALPEAANIIYTDPRSVGCNDIASFNDDTLTSYNVSADLAAIVEYLRQKNLKSYFLYGASFGTQAVTQAAVIIQKKKLPLPRGLILEGVGGHDFNGFQDYFKNFQSEWSYIKDNELDAVYKSFFEAPLPTVSSPLGYSSRVWGQFVANQVILGYLPQSNQRIEHLLNWYLSTNEGQAAAQEQMNGIALGTMDGTQIQMSRLFRMIGCQEIWGEMFMGRDIQQGELIAFGADLCVRLSKTNPYDSKNWQVKSPIYYFQGTHDPTTTLAHARYHFENQSLSAKKFFVDVKKAAHGPLSVTLRPCSEFIWKSILSGGSDLQPILAQCGKSLGADLEVIQQ